MDITVSIIIPSHNKDLYILACITSALNQSFKNIEVIVIDDNSTDSTKSILENIYDTRLHVYHKQYDNASAARNFGLSKATGNFIQFLDADDVLHTKKIEKQLHDMNYNETVLGVCGTNSFYNSIHEEGKEIDTAFLRYSSQPFDFIINLYSSVNCGMVQPNAWLTPLKLIQKAGSWNEHLSVDDDGEFFCRVILNAGKIVYTDQILNYYRKFNGTIGGLSTQKSNKAFRSIIEAAILKKQYIEEKASGLGVDTKPAINSLFSSIMVSAYPNYKQISLEAAKYLDKSAPVVIPVIGGKLLEIVKYFLGWKFAKIIHSFGRSYESY